MEEVRILSEELLGQKHLSASSLELERYKRLAESYAELDGALAVLSDMRTNRSYVYYGRFAESLPLAKATTEGQIPSIWEEEILGLIQPEDLRMKYLEELRFFHFIKQQDFAERAQYHLSSKLRMQGRAGRYLSVWHRMYYVHSPEDHSVSLALCLYSALPFELPAYAVVVNTLTGELRHLDKSQDATILSERECEVIRLIDKGLQSKEIAQQLFISVNTVSRHRQEILRKLQVKNSIEACRTARDLGIITS